MTITTSHAPSDGRPVTSVADTSPEDVETAVADAVRAAPELATTPPERRRAWLRSIAENLEDHADELVALADSETALGVPRLSAEVARTATQLRFYGDVAVEGSYLGVTVDNGTRSTPRLVRVNQPLGPVAVFGASNFPFAFSVLGNDTASALAAGCPVVAKAHPAHVGLSVRLAELAAESLVRAGAPEGTFSLVVGLRAGTQLVRADGTAAVAFTGSQAGGLALWRIVNERDRVIPMYAEMGTVNPVVVTRAGAARLDDVAKGFVGSFTLGSGQYCTKPGLMLVPRGLEAARVVADALLAAEPRPPMLTEAIARSVRTGLAVLEDAGATIVVTVPGVHAGWSAPAAVLSAPVSALRRGSELLRECFGAVALVVEYADEQELRSALDALHGSLAGTVVAGDATDFDARWVVEVLSRQVGRVTVGDWPTGVTCSWAQHHGGPWPATTAPAATSVGAGALGRFVRPVSYQSVPEPCLPPAGRADNPWWLPRRVDGRLEFPGSRA